ncbi:glucosylglycerol 3-phosphatase [Synechococcus sp. MU1651]|uniref:glucosylglycerol 3-phosphatase n=1 Tax=Synechococcus sp. MU1651 TaxID=2508353 RepID=UPI002026AD6D|nr:glucosylglycerol 3-phosphatase [Synechococcus sp. MU1651]
MPRLTPDQLLQELTGAEDLLIVQDLDGVCMQLVKDPLTRRMDPSYVDAVAALDGQFAVLTNGEHEGRRGVNRLVEQALGNSDLPRHEGRYLPGLAAGGVQLQDRFGDLSHPGVSPAEMAFLAAAPNRMEALLMERLPDLLPRVGVDDLAEVAKAAVLDTQVSPTINLNGIFELVPADVTTQQALQTMLSELMHQLLAEAAGQGLGKSFFLHVAPNLGRDAQGQERIKPAAAGDVGTTDIQFMLTGSIKEAGLLVLLNQHIQLRWGESPLGETFNVRTAPHDPEALLALVRQRIPSEWMPLLVGVGDTVTSTASADGKGWLRGGSDRGFLNLLQDLGDWCGRSNRVVLVDSSHGEVDRPSHADGSLQGITDPEDPLLIDVLMPDGPEQYIAWFRKLSERRRVG